MAGSIVFVTDNQISANSRHKPRFRRRRGACESCKRRKVRCNGTNPCNQCQKSSIECLYNSSSWKTNDGDTERGPSGSPVQQTRGSLTPPQTSPFGGMACDGSAEESSRFNGSDAHSLLMSLSNTDCTTNTESTEISQWQDWFVSDLPVPLGNDVQLTGTSDESLTDWLDPQLVNPADTAAIMQTLSGENLFQSSGPSYDMSEPLSLDSDPGGFNTTRNEQIAGCIQKLRSQRPFVLRDEHPEAPPSNNIMGHRGFYDAKFISQCFDACDTDPEGVRVLLERKSMDLIAHEITKDALAVDTETSVLFHSLMAIGCHSLNLDQGHRAIGKGKYPVLKFFKQALNARQHLRDSPSLGGLQAILTMAYFSARVGDDSTSSFLADAAFCVQTLQLHNASAIEQKYNSFQEQQVAKRALWFLYSLEKPRCLAEGLLPLIHDDFVDYDPPSSASYSASEVDWFAINARFARICSSIIRERLRCKSGRPPSRRGQDRASEYSASSVIKRLESLLEEWRDDLPFAGDFDATGSDEFAASTCSERRHRIKCLNKYWSAIIATHSGQARGVAEDGGAGVRLSRARCIDAAQAILQNSHYITSTDILSDISLYYYITVATRVIMTVVIRDRFASDIAGDPVHNNTATRTRETTHGRSIMSYVGIAIGLFSRLSLDIDVPVDEVTELGKLGR
ncbi:Fum21p [Fusarium nygamai]|uniref:Fum21p n=1 Tax=Gibberella nygamai TaxID=42673 RepID=V9TKG3_GIBNY|nr:fumonisin biosynthetic transcription factor [Fusarium nygamai]PNP80102.1 Fum21p [Fusarium nygamai]